MENNQPNNKIYVLIYSLAYLTVGLCYSAIGPIIPFLSKQRDLPETEFSYLFVANTIGSITGFVFFKYTLGNSSNFQGHKMLIASCLAKVASLVIFINWETTTGGFLSFFVLGAGNYMYLTIVNILILRVAGKKASSWVPFTHAFFGVGGLLAPLLIPLIENHVFSVLAAVEIALLFLLAKYKTPEEESNIETSNLQQDYKPSVSKKAQILFAIALLIAVGIEMTVAGWLPTFAVEVHAFNEYQASLFATLFWVMITLFRFVAASSTMKCTRKLSFLVNTIVVSSFLCVFLIFLEAYQLVTIVGTIGFGIGFSATIALILALPSEFDLKLEPDQVTNIFFASFFSPMVITAIVGELMKITMDSLFYSLLGLGILFLMNNIALVDRMKQESKWKVKRRDNPENGIELREMLIR